MYYIKFSSVLTHCFYRSSGLVKGCDESWARKGHVYSFLLLIFVRLMSKFSVYVDKPYDVSYSFFVLEILKLFSSYGNQV
jgi:hypothetical protein